MDSESQKELRLIEQIMSGNPSAMEAFFSRYADPLYAFIHHQLDGTRADVEDIWQETLMAAIGGLPAYRGKSRFFSWLCSIARHKIIDHIRKQGRRRDEVFSDLPVSQLSNALTPDHLPEDLILCQSTRIRVVEVLTMLPDEYRSALVARYADGKSVSEVAQVIGKSYKATAHSSGV
jgi:RNA polymerase sigma-70 factor (ECF subfamily)